jgi:fructose-specific phosphotransferase system IIA component
MEKKVLQLAGLLKEKCINLSLEGHNKKKLLEELVDFVVESGKIKDKKAILREIVKREKLGSTGIGYGVAIPHAKAQKAHGFVLVLGRHDEGIDFGALDGARTHLFFMLVSPEKEVGNHLKILAEISRLVKDKFIVERLKNARDKKEIVRIIEAYQG